MSLIILIGGTAGTGKSTLARKLANELNISHRIGTGFIREILRSVTNKNKSPSLFSYTFRSRNPVLNIINQAKILKPAIIRCIKRAREEGTSLIIEGNHLIPQLYKNEDFDLMFVISSDEKLEQQLKGKTHSERVISNQDLINIKKINNFILSDAESTNIPIIINKTIELSIKKVIKLLK